MVLLALLCFTVHRAVAADFSGWAGKMQITLDGYASSTHLTNFPVLITLSETTPTFYYTAFASDTGGDLRFSAADGTTELHYEIDEWHTDGTSLVWVQVPVLTNGVTLYAYWGNASEATAPAYTTNGSTWADGHLGVWHLNEPGNIPADSAVAVSDNSGTDLGTDGVVVDAIVGKGYDYTGAGRVDPGNKTNLHSLAEATLTCWYYKRSQGGANYGSLYGRWDNNGGLRHHSTAGEPLDIRFGGTYAASSGPLANGTWHFLAYTYDDAANALEVFLNGVSVDTSTVTSSWFNPDHLIGSGNRDDRCIDGIVDEMRVSSVVRSADWVRATFMTTASNAAVTAQQVVQAPPQIANLDPAGLSATAATLRADLFSTGVLETAVWVYVGDEDGATTPGAWDTNLLVGTAMSEGVVSEAVADLLESGIYYYRFFASNAAATAWSPTTTRFRTPTDFSAWGSRVSIVFTNCINTSPLELFPVLVTLDESIPGFSYEQFGAADGTDLRFAEADGVTELDYEIDGWNTGGTSTVWVQISSLTNGTQIWVYWNNAWASPGDTARTWSDRYLGVYHLHDDSNDSTANGNDGVAENGPTSCAGVIGDGLDFSGGARVDLGGDDGRWDEIDNEHHKAFTLGVWINPNTIAADQTLFGRFGDQFLLWLDKDSLANYVLTDRAAVHRTSESSGIAAVQDVWQYVVGTCDGSSLNVYVNGLHSSTYTGVVNLNSNVTQHIGLGTDHGDSVGKVLNGSLDEARIAYTPRSQEWIRTEFLNMASNDLFNTVGTVESTPSVRTLPAGDVLALSATLNGDVTSTGTAATVVWVYWGDEDGTTNPAAWDASASFGVVSAEGLVSTNVAGLEHETTYYYRFCASNSVGATWGATTESFETTTDFTRWVETVQISFTNYSRTTPLTNFPALVKLGPLVPGFSYLRFESDQGHDLRFSAADQTTPLHYEVETWDPDGDSYVWVQVPVLTNNTSIWAFWGSAADTGPAPSSVASAAWSEEYLGVYHLHADADDSTANANHGVEEGGPVNAAGVVGDGLDFEGGARVDLGSDSWDEIDRDHHDTFTMGAWVNPDSLSGDQTLFGRFGGPAQQLLLWLDVGDGLVNFVVYDDGGPRTPQNAGIAAQQDQWQYVVATSDGMLLHLYVNGVLSGSSPGTVSLAPSTLSLALGSEHGDSGGRALNGSLDEARITYACRPIDWIWAEYMNMASNDVFNTYGEVQYNASAGPVVANLAPTGTTYQSAWLRADLVSTGTAETAVWVYYGDEDGADNPAAWDAVAALGVQSAEGMVLSTEVTGLNAFSDYFYRFCASNAVGTAWAAETETFGTALRMGGWGRTARIDLDYDGATPLTNFPVLIVMGTNIAGFSYADVGSADGTDLRFAPADGRSLLNYEIEEWNPAGDSYVWVQVPVLDGNTSIHAYWGNPGAGAYASSTNGATWDDTFHAVYHLDQVGASPDVSDATANAHDGTNHGSQNTDGIISKGQDFERSSGNYIDLAGTPSAAFLPAPGSAITLSCWVRGESIAAGAMENRMISIHDSMPGSVLSFALSLDDNIEVYHDGTNGDDNLVSAGTVAPGQWYHAAVACDGTNVRLYIDGAFDSSELDSLNAGSSYAVKLGGYAGANSNFDGIIDELRVSKVARSADWIRACWLNQASNNAFVAFGTVEDNLLPDLPIVDALAATDVLGESATMNGALTATGTSATAVALYWGTSDGGGDVLAWDHAVPFPGAQAVGPLTESVTGLSEQTTYFYRFRAENATGIRWSLAAGSFTTYPLPDVDNANGADVAAGAAMLNGTLVAENGAACGAVIYWGDADGGTNAAAWANTNDLGAVAVGPFQGDTYAPAADWSNFSGTDVGPVGIAGSVSYSSGVWTVTGSGGNIWSSPDSFHYAYRPVRGNFDVYCRMSDYTGGTHDYRKGGIMARNSLSGSSVYAMCMRTPAADPAHQIRFQRRLTDGDATAETHISTATNAYYWLRLTRDGDRFHAYWADDAGGAPDTWSQITSGVSINMDDSIYIGLAVCSLNNGELTSATFDGWHGTGAEDNLLTYGQPYYYRSSATNVYGRGWADATTNFLSAQPSWVGITNTMAYDLTTTSATFHASLEAEAALFDVYAYWGATDEGTDLNAWAHTNYVGTYTNMISLDVSVADDGMVGDALYYYTFQATNIAGHVWAEPSASYRTVGPPTVTNVAPRDYTAGTATVGGVLTYGGNAYATVYWGLTDEGETAAAWGNTTHVGRVVMGMFETDITVGAGGTYFYRCHVSNELAQAWAPASTNFTTPGATLSIEDATVYEGDTGTIDMLFTVTPSVPCASNVTVLYQTSGGTAVAGTDYTTVSAALVIPAMQAQATIAVAVIGDTDFEWPDEYFYMDLSSATNATIANGHAVGTIGEDDVEFRDWLYKTKFTFSGYTGTETLRNFPVLVTFGSGITQFSYKQFASADGYDLRFTDGNQTRPLSYEIDHWDTNGISSVWVRVPELTGTNTSIYAYWGCTNELRAVSAPTDLPDCVLWLHAGAGVQTTGGAVTGWLDQSGQSNHAWQGTPVNQPSLVANALNGKPVVHFNGTNFLTVADDPTLDGMSGLTVFVVSTPYNLSGAPRGLVSKRSSSSAGRCYAQFFYSGDHLNNDIATTRFVSSTAFVNGNTYVTELVFDGTLPDAGTRSMLTVDGTHDITSSSGTSIPDEANPLTIATLNVGYGNFLRADYAEIIIYERTLTTNETASVGRYLEQKYALQSAYGTDIPVFASDGSTWSEGYGGVWHLSEDGTDTRRDATVNANDSSAVGGNPVLAAGRIGGGNAFDGNDTLIVLDSPSLGDETADSMSVSLWMKSTVPLTENADTYRALEKGDCYFLLQGNNANFGSGGMNFFAKRGGAVRATSTGIPMNAAQWYHVTGTFDGTDMRVYIDGTLMDTIATGGPIDDDGLPLRIGSDDSGKYFDGVLDEVRISTRARSTDWVRATYMNSASNAVFGVKDKVIVTHRETVFITR